MEKEAPSSGATEEVAEAMQDPQRLQRGKEVSYAAGTEC